MMTDRQLSDVLEECLTHLAEEHTSVEVCLARYPQHAAELRPLLEMAVALRHQPQPRARQAAVSAGKRRMLAAVREKQREAQGACENNPGLLDRCAGWIHGWVASLRPDGGFGWQTALATAAVLLIVALGAGVALAPWLGATVPRTARLEPLRGVVEVRAADTTAWLPAAPDQPLGAGDTVRTAAGAVARLTFYDGSTTALRDGAEVALLELSSRRDGTARAIVLHQGSGQTYHDVRPLRRAEARFQVRTPTAVIDVRGTAFDVIVDADGTTRVAEWRGLVEVYNLTGPGEHEITSVSLQPGWFTIVRPNRPPSQPVLVPTPLRDDIFAELPTAEPTETVTPTVTATPTTAPTRTPRPSATPKPTGTPRVVQDTPTPVLPTPTWTATSVPPTPTWTATPVPPTPEPTATTDPGGPGDPEPTHTPTPEPTPTREGPGDPEPTDTPTPVGPGNPEPPDESGG